MEYNDTYFANLRENYPNLEELKVENNVLFFQNRSISLGRFNIASLFYNYGDLIEDLSSLTANDLFIIIYVHVMYYQDNEKFLKNFRIIKKRENEEQLVKYYQDYLYYLLRYKDYLTTDLTNFVNDIIQKVISSEYKDYHTPEELDFNSKFHEINNLANEDKRVWQEKKQKSDKLLLKKDNSSKISGYANAFVVLLTSLFFGIIISVILLVLLN